MISRYKASLKLLAIADALGYMSEGIDSQEDLKKKIGIDKIETFHKWENHKPGRFQDNKFTVNEGEYSDVTQMSLAVARSIQYDGEMDHNYFAKRELANWDKYERCGGNTVRGASTNIRKKQVKWNTNFHEHKRKGKTRDYRNCGANGVAMRVLPIVLAFHKNWHKIKDNIFANAIVTHGHPRAIIGAFLYASVLEYILDNSLDTFTCKKLLDHISSNYDDDCCIPFFRNADYKEWLSIWDKNQAKVFKDLYSEILDETRNKLDILKDGITKSKAIEETLDDLGCTQSGIKRYGTSTILGGILMFCKYIDKPEQGIIKTVNTFNTDKKVIAAFAGSLYGALYGESAIPDKWKNVQDAQYIETVASKLFDISNNAKLISDIVTDCVNVGDKVRFEPHGVGIIKRKDLVETKRFKNKKMLMIFVEFESGQSCQFKKYVNI